MALTFEAGIVKNVGLKGFCMCYHENVEANCYVGGGENHTYLFDYYFVFNHFTSYLTTVALH